MRALPAHRFTVGLDLGQVNDPSALAVIETDYVDRGTDAATYEPLFEERHILRFCERLPLQTPYPAVVSRVVEVCEKLAPSPHFPDQRIPQLVVDGTGVGRAVVDQFRLYKSGIPLRRISETFEYPPPRPGLFELVAVSITNSGKPREQDGYWHVSKKDLVAHLQLLLQRSRLRILEKLPEYPVLIRELLNFKLKISQAGNASYSAWREHEHDDLVLAVALAAWRAAPKKLPPVEGTRRLYW